MGKIFVNFFVAFMLSIFIFVIPAFAIPSLQLDIKNGTYNNSTQTIVASQNKFTLYAYLKPDCKASLEDQYFISVAIHPQVTVDSDLGEFSFAGDTYGVTDDMIYGDPPLEISAGKQGHDAGDLGEHGIFPTYFMEYAFEFDSDNRAIGYDTQLHPGQGPTPSSNGDMYYQSFEVDISALDKPYVIHFDLYNRIVYNVSPNKNKCSKTGKSCSYDVDIKSFAPFSHDAESGLKIPPQPPHVPEPSTILLLGTGILGLGLWGKRRA
ncbi:MAG: choice-of-anchor N protein [Nitrospirae bacterium]|nr:choice-of-anchor N protein [Nitrospirota bacterium]